MEKYSCINGIKILLAEDNKFYQLLTKRVLEKAGYILHIADNGKEALQKIEKENYALVLMDLQMPEMNGFEATHLIRSASDKRINKIPIIAMTAHDVNDEGPGCILAGMNDYISKPFEAELLHEKIRNLIAETKNVFSERTCVADTGNTMSEEMDLKFLKNLLGDSTEILTEVLGTLYQELPVQIENLKSDLEKENWKQLSEDAHKMRSCIMMIGMPEFLSQIETIERFGKEKSNLSLLPGLVEQTVTICCKIILQVKTELEKLLY